MASRCFEQAARSSSFLRFVVEQTLAGQGERLKGYTIAVEVFGRPAEFDAQSDPLVRVEAGRLRRRLIEYYADEGRHDPIRIDLPRGSYSAVYTYPDAQPAEAPPEPALAAAAAAGAAVENGTARNRRRWRRVRSLVVVAAIAIGSAVILWQRGEVARLEHGDIVPIGDGLAGRPALVVQPFEMLGGAGSTELAATLTEELFLVLDEPEALVVPAVPSGTAAATSPGYVLSGSVRESDGIARITARVVRTDTGTQLWSAAYDEPLEGLRAAAGQRRIARLVALVAAPYGPIFEAETERLRTITAHEPLTRDCVLRYYQYRRAFGAAEHAQAAECFDLVAKREPESAEAWAGLALVAVDAFAHGFAGQAGRQAALDRAREAARRAMDIDGQNLHANLALASVQYFSGDDFHRAADRILADWPENAEAQAYLGAMFLLSGEAHRGDALVAIAMEWTPEVPSGYYASRSLGALRAQHYHDALALALRMDAPDWPLGQAIVAAVAALGGRADLAARAYARLMQLDATIARSPQDLLRRWRIEPVLAAELERGIAAAASQ